jgi:uncharacterized lipoprotein YajG
MRILILLAAIFFIAGCQKTIHEAKAPSIDVALR